LRSSPGKGSRLQTAWMVYYINGLRNIEWGHPSAGRSVLGPGGEIDLLVVAWMFAREIWRIWRRGESRWS
jgi:hypothetical protein